MMMIHRQDQEDQHQRQLWQHENDGRDGNIGLVVGGNNKHHRTTTVVG